MGPKTAAAVEIVRANPGKTAREYATLQGLGSSGGCGFSSLLEIAKALGLVESRRIEPPGERPCAVWYPTDAPIPEPARRMKLPPADPYRLLSECVERGVAYGLRRAHKHTDTPTNEQIEEAISSAVMGEIAEAFVFPDVAK